jgi:hypothetical protein
MDIGPSIVAKLLADIPTTGLIGNRIYPEFQPEICKRFPLIVYTCDKAEADESYSGASGLANQSIKVQCISKTRDQAAALGRIVFNVLADMAGIWGGVQIQDCSYVTEEESMEPMPEMGPDVILHVRELEFNVWYSLILPIDYQICLLTDNNKRLCIDH